MEKATLIGLLYGLKKSLHLPVFLGVILHLMHNDGAQKNNSNFEGSFGDNFPYTSITKNFLR